MIDEKTRRKPNFDERNSSPVVLADGQTWHLPKPWLELRPVFRDGKPVTAYGLLTSGAELDELVEAIGEAETFRAQVVGAASLAARLLLHHYDLSDADLDELLRFRVSDPASLAWMENVIEIATGQSGPKPSGAGNA